MFIVFISTKTRITGILLLLAVAALFLCKGSIVNYFCGVKRGVTFMELEMGGLSREKVNEIVAARLGEWLLSPVDAHFDAHSNSVVPELWGYTVDTAETVDRIMEAPEGTAVLPVLVPQLPAIKMDDYPAAVISRGNPLKKEIAFMINVAWGTEFIVPMLEVLQYEEALGSFFVVGRWAYQEEDMAREIAERGHLIANHGHTDAVVYSELSAEDCRRGLVEVNDYIEQVTGKKPRYFTPHKGEYNRLVLEVASREGMRTLLWSIDTVDWMEPGVEKMKSRVLDNLHGGAIVLMHPTRDTVIFLRETIPLIKSRGFDIVTVEQLLNPDYPPALLQAGK